jgi:amylovoran biosynthesis glycosyltransferase AmsB
LKFSVVIPCFRASNTIARALDSLVKQTYSNFEVVLVDDASADFDEALSVIESFNSRLDIRVLRNTVNKNGAFSRNRGIEAAQGDFVAFLDADDSWVETRLASAKNLIENLADRNFVIYGQFELIQKGFNGALLPLRAINKNELVSEYVFAAGQSMQTSTFLCPLEVARDVLFDENYSRHQDTDFMMRAQGNGVNLVFQDNKCSNYYIKPSDIVSRIKEGRINRLFCKTWLNEKFAFFNTKSYAGYKLIVYSRVLYLENYALKALAVAFMSAPRIGFKNFIDLVKTKAHIIKGRLAWVCFLNSNLYLCFSEFSTDPCISTAAFFI